jgi:hypothetical protein
MAVQLDCTDGPVQILYRLVFRRSRYGTRDMSGGEGSWDRWDKKIKANCITTPPLGFCRK